MKIVLDTNVYADYAEGLPDVVDILAKRSSLIFIPAIVLGELRYGFMKGSRQQFNEDRLDRFMDVLKVRIIDVNDDVARKYATIVLSLTKRGSKIPINDVWIAACCMSSGGMLLTRDKHFESVDQLDKIILQKGV
jgi:predicted nucleic acid-binding protein